MRLVFGKTVVPGRALRTVWRCQDEQRPAPVVDTVVSLVFFSSQITLNQYSSLRLAPPLRQLLCARVLLTVMVPAYIQWAPETLQTSFLRFLDR